MIQETGMETMNNAFGFLQKHRFFQKMVVLQRQMMVQPFNTPLAPLGCPMSRHTQARSMVLMEFLLAGFQLMVIGF